MSTMREVAAAAGVSVKTVSRVFNGDPHVLRPTRERVQAILREMNYVPSDLPAALRAGRASVIGVAIPDIIDPFFAAITQAVQISANERGMQTLVTSLGGDVSAEPSMVEGLLKRGLSGLIMTPIGPDQSYLRAWSGKVPLVFVDRQPSQLAADSISDDDEGGAVLATRHLLEHGHRRIAFLGDHPVFLTTIKRVEGYCAELGRSGIEPDEDLIVPGVNDRAEAREAVTRLLALPDPPTAIFSSNARCTMVLLPAIENLGLAVVGFGDFPMADVVTPSVTVIDQDPHKIGRLAAERVFDRLDHPARRFRRRTVLPVGLRRRRSCCATPQNPAGEPCT
ncbi:LacI family DNA-binding transcriptional regulator [Nakamurella sp. A5-74]|uniref:LacI family DNA-binding transcriptional regulator n=1 Tax=Nakamurella sp. A5-74 TaxID=3158264 RepID=A0AAU8DSI7_9ACTN